MPGSLRVSAPPSAPASGEVGGEELLDLVHGQPLPGAEAALPEPLVEHYRDTEPGERISAVSRARARSLE